MVNVSYLKYRYMVFDTQIRLGDKMQNTETLIKELVSQDECEWLEFKHDTNKPEMIAKRISAIANSCASIHRSQGYIIWGIQDNDHKIIGTSFNPQSQKVKGEELSSWLNRYLSDNADYEFIKCNIDGKQLILLTISAAKLFPVSFQNKVYIREGSYTKELMPHHQFANKLWSSLNSQSFETMTAMEDCTTEELKKLIDIDAVITMLDLPEPTTDQSITHMLEDNNIIESQDNGLFSITNLGALLFSKDLTRFSILKRKCLRIIKYNGKTKTEIARQTEDTRGYAVGFEDNIRAIVLMLPSSEVIVSGKAILREHYPSIAIRELLANAMIHQDLSQTGMNLSIEVFDDRIEISNPGSMLIDTNRLLDASPKSRNEKMASMMRRAKLCEELGSGWDKIVQSCESQTSPTPIVRSDENGTRIILKDLADFRYIPIDDRIWNCYMHTCYCYMNGGGSTNSSLRERFGMEKTNSNMVTISNLIKETKKRGLIKPLDDKQSPRTMKYVPYWC